MASRFGLCEATGLRQFNSEKSANRTGYSLTTSEHKAVECVHCGKFHVIGTKKDKVVRGGWNLDGRQENSYNPYYVATKRLKIIDNPCTKCGAKPKISCKKWSDSLGYTKMTTFHPERKIKKDVDVSTA